MPGNPNWANVKLAFPCRWRMGTVNYGTIQSAISLSNASLVEGDFNYSTGRLSFTGSNSAYSYAQIATDNAFNPGSGDMGCRFRFRVNAHSSGDMSVLVMRRAGSGITGTNEQFLVGVQSSGLISLTYYQNNTTAIFSLASATGLVQLNTDYEVEFNRSGNVWRMYLDGVTVIEHTSATAVQASTVPIRLGGFGAAWPNRGLNGYIWDFQYMVGSPFHTEPYTPLKSPFDIGSYVITGTVRDSSGNLVANRRVSLYRNASREWVSEGYTNASGYIALSTLYNEEHYIVAQLESGRNYLVQSGLTPVAAS